MKNNMYSVYNLKRSQYQFIFNFNGLPLSTYILNICSSLQLNVFTIPSIYQNDKVKNSLL